MFTLFVNRFYFMSEIKSMAINNNTKLKFTFIKLIVTVD